MNSPKSATEILFEDIYPSGKTNPSFVIARGGNVWNYLTHKIPSLLEGKCMGLCSTLLHLPPRQSRGQTPAGTAGKKLCKIVQNCAKIVNLCKYFLKNIKVFFKNAVIP